jgi:hypothetical protein
MGEILAFSPRPPASDWSPNERGLLMLLTQQLSSTYGEVDGVFGQTDSGDPWYVVTDASQDVLVHVARIDGQFVVHDAAVDMFHQVGSLWGALRQMLASNIADPSGVVVAFNPSSREAQSFLSLVIAVGLYLELRGIELGEAGPLNFENLPRVDDPAIQGVASKLIAALNLEADRAQDHALALPAAAGETAVAAPPVKVTAPQGVVVETPAPAQGDLGAVQASHSAETGATSASSSPVHPTVQQSGGDTHEGQFEITTLASDLSAPGTGLVGARYVTAGTSGADTMKGTAEGDVIAGGGGNDYIDGGGAQKGQIDRIDGGAGDDIIVMDARVVASGSGGADTFLIAANEPTDKAGTLLGVVLDFSAAKGDHMAVMGSGHVTVVSAQAVGDVLAVQGATLGENTAAQVSDVTRAVSGTRVGFDIDGDGREDVFILLGGASTSDFKIGLTIANDHADTKVALVGQSTTTDITTHAGDTPATH